MSEAQRIADGLDVWCKRRASLLSGEMHKHIMAGRSLEDPRYRTLLGRHQAYMAMRSYIHGSLKQKEPSE